MSPAPSTRHQEVTFELAVLIRAFVKEHGLGRVFIAPVDVVLSDHNVVEPDIVYVGREQLDIVNDLNIRGVPLLLVEVVSSSRMDRVRKRDLYERFGVPEYWVTDPDADRIEVSRLQAGRYGKPEIYLPGDLLTTPLLPGLEVDIAALLTRPASM